MLNDNPELASTGPPDVLTTCVRYSAAGTRLVALEKTSSGPVTSRICADANVTTATRS